MKDENVYLIEESGTSTSLLQRAIALQPEAWTRIVSLYGPLVYRWFRQWGHQPHDADLLGQEVFLKVWRSLNSFRRDHPHGRFRNWLFRIARNCAVDHYRKVQRLDATGGSSLGAALAAISADGSEDLDAISEERAILYRRAVELIRSEFGERDWQAFQGLVIEDRSAAEIATQLGISTNVVYITKSRVLRRLRDEFAGLIEF